MVSFEARTFSSVSGNAKPLLFEYEWCCSVFPHLGHNFELRLASSGNIIPRPKHRYRWVVVLVLRGVRRNVFLLRSWYVQRPEYCKWNISKQTSYTNFNWCLAVQLAQSMTPGAGLPSITFFNPAFLCLLPTIQQEHTIPQDTLYFRESNVR